MRKSSKDRIDKIIEKWKPRLLLDDWAISIVYSDKDSIKGKDVSQADIVVNGRYKEALLTIYPSLMKRPISYITATLVHELKHIHTAPIHQALSVACTKGIISENRVRDLIEGFTEVHSKMLYRAYTRNHKKNGYHV